MYIFQVGEAKKHTHILWVYVFLLLPPPPPFQTKPHPPLFFSSSEIYCLVGGGGLVPQTLERVAQRGGKFEICV